MMKQSELISVIIPTINEAGSLERLISAIDKNLNKQSYEVIVVDDGSDDGTEEVIQLLQKNFDNLILIQRRGKERGLGISILEGIRRARGEYILGMDADYNHDPRFISELLKSLKSGADLAVGSRYIGEYRKMGIKNYPFSYIFNLLAHALGMPISDNTSGYYAISRVKLIKLPLDYIFRGYGDYHLRLVDEVGRRGLVIREIPIEYGKRNYGESKSRMIKMFGSYLREILRIRISDCLKREKYER